MLKRGAADCYTLQKLVKFIRALQNRFFSDLNSLNATIPAPTQSGRKQTDQGLE